MASPPPNPYAPQSPAMSPWRGSDPKVRISRGITPSRAKGARAAAAKSLVSQTLIGWRGRYPLDRGLGFGHISVGAAVQQCLRQNTRRQNPPRQWLALTEQVVGSGARPAG